MIDERTPKPIRVVVVYRVCQHWRAPMFARLNARPEIDLAVFHGQSIPGTKLINGEHLEGFAHKEHWTLSGRVRGGGRTTPWVVCPMIWWSLIRHAPDVILAEGGSNILTNLFVFAYAKLWRRPVIWWTLGELPGRRFSGLRKLYRRFRITMERSATILLGYSSVALKYFQSIGIPPERCFRAVNCVDTDRVFRDIEQGASRVPALRRKLGMEGKRVLLFVGALTAAKKIDRLLHAFARIVPELPETRLLMVGDGPDRARLEELAGTLGIAERCHFAGQIIEGVSDYYELADLFILPGLGGLAVSEALAHGLPVICSRGDGCEVDLVVPGQTGYRTEADDDAEVIDFIAARAREILSDEGRLAEMSEAARRIIVEKYNVHTYLDNIVAAIQAAYAWRIGRTWEAPKYETDS